MDCIAAVVWFYLRPWQLPSTQLSRFAPEPALQPAFCQTRSSGAVREFAVHHLKVHELLNPWLYKDVWVPLIRDSQNPKALTRATMSLNRMFDGVDRAFASSFRILTEDVTAIEVPLETLKRRPQNHPIRENHGKKPDKSGTFREKLRTSSQE